MSLGPFAWIPSPGPRAGSQMPEISWRGAGPGFSPGFSASVTGRPQPSRSTGPGGTCGSFLDAGVSPGFDPAFSADALCARARDDDRSTVSTTLDAAAQPFQ